MAGLYNGLFVMRDRETGSVWTHYDGTILTGPLAGTGLRMEIEPILHLRWSDWLDRYPEGLARMGAWLDAGLISYREDLTEGLEAAPEALIGLLEGRNFGKAIVKISDPAT